MALGWQFGSAVRLASSPVPRAVETAAALAEGAGIDAGSIVHLAELKLFLASGPEPYEDVKRRLGWTELMATWADGALPGGVLQLCEVRCAGGDRGAAARVRANPSRRGHA